LKLTGPPQRRQNEESKRPVKPGGRRKPDERRLVAAAPTSRRAVASPAAPLTARDLLTAYRPDLAQVLVKLQAPAYRFNQVCEHLFRRPLEPFAQSTVLPGPVRAALDQLGTSTLAVAASQTSTDRATKLALTTTEGALVEMVVMRYRQRVTACISSQVGCPVGCVFCATGSGGFERNLSAAEIVDQVRVACALLVEEGARLSNLVYMGMGEPLLNLQAVLDSIRILTSPHGLDLGHRSLSISTVGIPTGIRRLARTEPQVNLALSLHASDDHTRERLIPATYRHPLGTILDAAWDHFATTRRKLLVEYVLLEGINDSTADARRLATLLRGRVVTVNLLTWNPVAGLAPITTPSLDKGLRTSTVSPLKRSTRPTVKSAAAKNAASEAGAVVPASVPGFRPSSAAAMAAFRDTLVNAGIETVIRRSKGVGIDAACGQLSGRRRTADRRNR
jgi:23S rRNA (adenine2503-C2)-methyltransferase